MTAPIPLPDPVPDLVTEIVGVFVGTPQPLGEVRGRPVESAIAKAPVVASRLRLDTLNLDGDRQADLSVHGGPDKAVYVYAADHYAAWQRDGFAVDVGGLGENVAVAGATEHDVLLGDVWRWGDALVQVSQPRSPCFKLAIHAGRKDIGPRMIETRRCGWYLRVLRPGEVPTGGPLELHDRDAGAPSVHEMFAAMFGGEGDEDVVDDGVVERLLSSPALAEAWRSPLAARRVRARR